MKFMLKSSLIFIATTLFITFPLQVIVKLLIKSKKTALMVPTKSSMIESWSGYATIVIWQFCQSIAIIVMMTSLFNVFYVSYHKITNELKILDYALKILKERVNELMKLDEERRSKYSGGTRENLAKDSAKYYKIALKQCVKHHLLILRSFSDLQNLMNVLGFAGNMIVTIVLICAGGLMYSNDDAVRAKFYIVFTIVLIFISAVYTICQKIGDSSENILTTLYDINYWELPKECHLTFRIMMVGALRPLVLRAYGGRHLNMENLQSLLSAAYSYFNILMQLKN